MSKHFTHLHLHTEFSLLDGALRLTDLVSYAKEQQWKSIGISDHGNIFGAVKFFQLAKKEGIKPVLGCEMYLTSDVSIKDAKEKYFHLIVIVQNAVGYKNLCQLMAFAYQDGFYFKPRIDYATLQKYSEGLIISTACVGGHIPSLLRDGQTDEAIRRIEWGLEVFGRDRFFFEVMPEDFEKQVATNKVMFEYAKKYDIKVIATGDAHYLHECDREAHEVMLAIQTKDVMSNPDRYSFGEARCHLKSTQEMLNAFPNNPEAIWNTGFIADQCDFNFEFGKLFFPKYPVPESFTQDSYFDHLCKQGLLKLKEGGLVPANLHEQYNQRLQLEIDLIVTMGFVGYFLVVSDFIQWAKRVGIPVGPGRGSAAGSLVAWSLEITNIDPIKYNLLFERFLNPERVTMPDIDIDFCIEGREKVINYVKEKYGHECVCQIITFGTMMAKGVIKDVARALGFPFQDSNALTEMVPDQLKITLQEALDQEPRLKDMIDRNPKVEHLIDICFKLEGLTRHASKHAAGVVISPEALREMLPLYIPPKTNELVTQYAMTELESLGFLKMDFLGLKNLTVIDHAIKTIKEHHDVEINLDKVPMDDPATFKLLCQAKSSGIFQFEGDGVTDVLYKLQPEKFEDLIALNALYRPGPLGSGMVDDFIDRRHGRKKTTYMFPQLEPILAETYGVIVYQEQVMKIASTIAGYTLGGADILRRAMGKKKAEVMAEQKALFVEGAIKNGFNSQKSGELFDLMAYFAGYGFNKSHSAAYALISYHTAYLKAHYPHEFMAALLSYETSDPDKLSFYLQRCKEMAIKAEQPDINSSHMHFTPTTHGILFGLQGIKNVGHAALENIVEERKKKPFTDLLDFCKRIDLRTANKRVVESLICAGAFDKMPGNRAQKMHDLENIIAVAQSAKEAAKTGQMGLFEIVKPAGSTADEAYAFQPLAEWSTKEKLERERAVAGFYLSAHPLDSYASVATWLGCASFTDLLARIATIQGTQEPTVIGFGLMQSHKVITTKKGDRMAFAEFEDFSGPCETVLFPKTFAKVEKWLGSYNIFIIKGILDVTSSQKCKIKANEIVPIDLLWDEWKQFEHLTIQLPPHVDQAFCQKIKSSLPSGPTPLRLMFQENDATLKIATQQRVKISFSHLQELESLGAKPMIGI